ncbi:hypothetical protein N7468_000663 [Penicillium chermesinum]|uniref:N-acetyltransferase domain-containing protein n=1 Tax=Penicillium chermesinum TaxID=63820 RepID=A0A9W9PKR8_9EURO|nr:uncharacterized protein N7468_000663 [Penicillium chermesinum]KAJ5249212.1 hypothetical protein N7468_000663 [Penicillium chermesinum]KAJ6151306.1 hypothetical protein N7470_007900 [Penicillium chermesinum]
MAYQFFPKSQSRSSTPRPSAPAASRAGPPIHPPPLQPPDVAKSHVTKESFTPYPHTVAAAYRTPHPHITVETVKTAHIPSLTRITGLLLPIRYPNSFYTAIITDPVVASISRVAVYHDHPTPTFTDENETSWNNKVIGGIRCRLERLEAEPEAEKPEATNLYIQTLHLLSPYRGHGVAASLLNSILYTSNETDASKRTVSDLVKHYNIRSVTAHVHEANEDALKWYESRGFVLKDGVIEGYYRRLSPSGAKIVQLDVPWEEATGAAKVKSPPAATGAPQERELSPNDADDEDWEKVEVEDGEDDDHDVLHESQIFERNESEALPRKRKAEEQNGSQTQRR